MSEEEKVTGGGENTLESSYRLKIDGIANSLTEKIESLSLSAYDKAEILGFINELKDFVNESFNDANFENIDPWYAPSDMTEYDLDNLAKQMSKEFDEDVKEIDQVNSQMDGKQEHFTGVHVHSKLSLDEEELIRYKLLVSDVSAFDEINTDAKVIGTFDDKGKFKKVDNPS